MSAVGFLGIPGLRLGAHVELFKRDEATGEQKLVHSSRPCPDCLGDLTEGLLAPVPGEPDRLMHAECLGERRLDG